MRTTKSIFKDKYSENQIKQYYLDNLKFKGSVGIDRINSRLFEKNLNKYINDIQRKVNNGTYKFIPYKQKLFLKGSKKLPRMISVPTIRDKITLGLLKEILYEKFENELSHKLVQTIIYDIQNDISTGEYDCFIKMDLKKFYDSIQHEKLFKRIRRKIRYQPVLDILRRAIKTPSTSEITMKKDRENNYKGVPQGLPISNILASIYLVNFDKKFKHHQNNFSYHRYVDDILILCKSKDAKSIENTIKKDLISKSKLEINGSKLIKVTLITFLLI